MADTFTAAYVECALWCGLDEGEHGDLAPETLAAMTADCAAFLDDPATVAAIDGRDRAAGHDFWLTRNGHGAGFWEGPPRWPVAAGELLDARAKAAGSVDLYLGDDGRIYQSR